MNKLALRFLNNPVLVLLVIIGVAVQTSLFSFYPLLYLQPDFVLIAVIWFALRRGFLEGGILTLLVGHVAEIHTSAPGGIFLSCYMALYLGLRALARYFMIPRLSSLVIVTLFASVAWKLLMLFILYLMGSAANQWRHTLVLMPFGAAMAGLVGIWAYAWFEKLDWITFKDPRARQALEDELRLSDEWL